MLKDDFLLVEKNATFYKKNTHTHTKKKDLLMLTTRIYIFKMHLNMAKLRWMNTSFLEKWHHLEYHQNKHLCINKAVKIKHYHTWIISENYFRDQWLLSFMFWLEVYLWILSKILLCFCEKQVLGLVSNSTYISVLFHSILGWKEVNSMLLLHSKSKITWCHH